MYAQPVTTLCLAQGFSRYLLSGSPVTRRRARYAIVFFFICTAPSQIYYAYESLGTYGGGLAEIVRGSALGVSFKPPKNLKYQGIESDISNVVSAKMLSMYTQGIDTRFLSRSYMDNIANIAVLKFLRTPEPRPRAPGAARGEAVPHPLHAPPGDPEGGHPRLQGRDDPQGGEQRPLREQLDGDELQAPQLQRPPLHLDPHRPRPLQQAEPRHGLDGPEHVPVQARERREGQAGLPCTRS